MVSACAPKRVSAAMATQSFPLIATSALPLYSIIDMLLRLNKEENREDVLGDDERRRVISHTQADMSASAHLKAMIHRAVHPSLHEPDLALNLEICDFVNYEKKNLYAE